MNRSIQLRTAGLLMAGLTLTWAWAASAVTGAIVQGTVLSPQTSATTTNGLLTVNASPRSFNNSSLNIGVAGGRNNASVDTVGADVEELAFVFDASVGMQSFKTAWTDGHIHLDGFSEDPGAYIITDPAISTNAITIDPFDAANQRVVIHHPWQNNTIAEFGFSNVAASAGRSIRVYVEETVIDSSGPQVGINELAYTDPVSGSPLYTVGTDLISNTSASTADGLVTMTASPRDFSGSGDFFGIAGGSNQNAVDNNVDGGTNAVPGEMIEFTFDESVGPLVFTTRWSRAQIVWEGWTEDPEAFIVTPETALTVLPYDAENQRVVINHPWQGGNATEIGFANPGAGAGQTLRLWVYDPNEANPQVALVGIRYGTPPPRLIIDTAAVRAGDTGPVFVMDWASVSGEVFAVETSGIVTGGWAAIETNIAATPPTNSYAVAADVGAAFVRLTKEARGGTLFSDDLEAGDTATRWTAGSDNGLAWELGAPSPLAPPAVGPAAAHSPTQCYGTDLGGSYGTLQSPSLRSPVIDLAGVTQATLRFYHFQDIEESGSQSTPYQFDTGVVKVLMASDSSVIDAELFITEGTSTDWELVEVALPIAAMNNQIVVEFVFDADGFQDVAQGGWYIDDIEVTSP